MVRKSLGGAILLFVCSFVITPLVCAGQSEREAMFQKYLDFPSSVKGGTIVPHWMADGNSFWFAEGAPDKTIIYKVDPVANTKQPLFDTDRLRKALILFLGHEPPYQGLPFESFSFEGDKAIQFTVEGKTFRCDLESYAITRVPSVSPDEVARFMAETFMREYFLGGRRPAPERSKAFQDVVYGNFGRNEIPDHAVALKQLGEQHPYLDLKREGIFGWSWGGYFTFRALTLAPDTYQVGVCGAPGFSAYNLMLYEPYLGLPQDNKEAYDYCTCFWLADQLKGKILFVNGTSDWATYPDTIRMIEALVRIGKPYDLVLLPEQGHGPIGKSMTYFIDAAKRYFLTNLPPEGK